MPSTSTWASAVAVSASRSPRFDSRILIRACSETTADGKFTMTEVECLGACVNAPMVQINDDYVEDLTPEKMIDVLKSIEAGNGYKPGPQNGRKGCIGPQGKTSLKGPPPAPQCRDLAADKKKYDEAKAAAKAAAANKPK